MGPTHLLDSSAFFGLLKVVPPPPGTHNSAWTAGPMHTLSCSVEQEDQFLSPQEAAHNPLKPVAWPGELLCTAGRSRRAAAAVS